MKKEGRLYQLGRDVVRDTRAPDPPQAPRHQCGPQETIKHINGITTTNTQTSV